MKGVGNKLNFYIVMKKFFYVAVMALALTACGNAAKENAVVDATDIVPAAATEVAPVAAPSAENGGKVATEVVPGAVKEATK